MATAVETIVPRLKQRYLDEIRPALMAELGLSSVMQVPAVTKITLNMGVGEAKTDAKALDAAIEELTTIAGQRAQVRRARKSIASFKVREGMAVGARVTVRGARMYEFLDRLVSIALPRIRDFRGLDPGSFDGRGNYSLGIGVITALRKGIEGKFKDRLKKAESIDPGYLDGAIQTAWGRFYFKLPWPKYDGRKSEIYLRRALERNPASVRAHVYLADLYEKADRPAQARQELEAAVARPAGAYDPPEERRYQEVARDRLARKG